MWVANALDAAGGGATRPDAQHEHPAGWCAELGLRFEQRRGRTVLASRHQRGPLLVQRPFYPEGSGVCHCYLIHPPGGIVGGDDLAVTLDLNSAAHALVTTPAATRWYFSRGREARARQSATLADGATLEWLPQETLLFDGAHARLVTSIHLNGAAQFCGWEILGFGRPACGERFCSGSIDFRFELFRDGRPLLLERLRGDGGEPPGLRGYATCGTFLATGASAAALETARETFAATRDVLGAATLFDGLLIGRGLAAHCEPLKIVFGELWQGLRPMLLGDVAVPPRIWCT